MSRHRRDPHTVRILSRNIVRRSKLHQRTERIPNNLTQQAADRAIERSTEAGHGHLSKVLLAIPRPSRTPFQLRPTRSRAA
jgi:hypothetical protein